MAQVHPARSPVTNTLHSVLDPHSSQTDSPRGPLAFSSLADSSSNSHLRLSHPASSQGHHHAQMSHGSTASTHAAVAPGSSVLGAGQGHNQTARRLPPAASSGGGNTEMRAQIRKEREAARNGFRETDRPVTASTSSGSGFAGSAASQAAPATDDHAAPSASTVAGEYASGAEVGTVQSNDQHSIAAETGLQHADSKSIQRDDEDLKRQQKPPSLHQGAWSQAHAPSAFQNGHQRVQTQPLNLSGRTEGRLSSSDSSTGSHFQVNPKRLSTGSAVAAAVRKLEEDAKAQMGSVQQGDSNRATNKDRKSDDRFNPNPPPPEFAAGSKQSVGPPESYDQAFGMEALQAAFSAKYYELASKCKNWERYAAKLRAQTEALEVENRILREANAQQESHILVLETENHTLKDQSAVRETRAREVESRLSSLEHRLSLSHAAQQHMQQQPQQQMHLAPRLDQLQDLRTALEAAYLTPSSPHTSNSQDLTVSGPRSTAGFHSSNIVYHDDERIHYPLRAPTPLTDHMLSEGPPGQISAKMPLSRNHSGHNQRNSIVMYDAANREHGDIYGEGRASRLGNRTLENVHGIQGPNASMTFTDYDTATQAFSSLHSGSDAGPSVALTSQALAAFDQHHRVRSSNQTRQPDEMSSLAQSARALRPSQAPRLASSPSMAGQKRSTVEPQQNMAQSGMIASQSNPAITRQISGNLPKSRNTNSSFDPSMMRSSASLPMLPIGSGDTNLSLNATETATLLPVQYLQAQSQLHARVRSGSAISDAGTVTGWSQSRAQSNSEQAMQSQMALSAASSSEYLAEQASQRRRLRRTSMSQQQQLAQIQAQREASQWSNEGAPNVPSRSGSRSSNLSGDGHNRRRGSKTRSRAGSASVHDSIPIIKDDIFSDGRLSSLDDVSSASIAITHSQSHPSLSTHGRSASMGPIGPPPASSNGMGRGAQPFGNITNTHHQQRNSSGGGEHYRASTSDGALNTLKPAFGRTASGSSLASQSSASQLTSSSGQLAHQSSNLSQGSSQHAIEASTGSIEGLAQIDEELTAEAKRGAHRRLYIALREELPEAELTKFERYVHRYDASEIPLDGPRGLVNRVKKLLILSDSTLKERPAELRRRKDLAREFERIVRVDTE